MGLIKAALGSAGGVMADQWKEYFYCESMPADVLAARGWKRQSGFGANRGNDNIISNGSIVAVADGQCAMIVEQGKVVDICAEPGEYTYDTGTEPSLFSGDLSDSIGAVFQNIGKRFTFGGEAPKDQRIYYFNTKELVGNKYGTPSPVPFRVVDQRAGIDMEKARAYVDGWDKAYASNTGLLLFGDVGTGKSFFAGCIANALLDRDISVMMTNFPTILSRLTGMFPEERIDYIDSIGRYDLLILDDFGVERNTSYAMEQMFHIVDQRYRSCKPLIVTTNLTLEQMKNPPDLEHSRIYGRILEHCAPILFSGKDMRKDNADTTKNTAREILSAKTTL